MISIKRIHTFFQNVEFFVEEVINKVRELDEAAHFLQPVSKKQAPDYYGIIQNPMDLQTIRTRARDQIYLTRRDFLVDCRWVVEMRLDSNTDR